MSWRLLVQEKNLAGFTRLEASEYGAMVVKASKGLTVPQLCQTEDDIINFAGKPTVDYPEILEAIEYVKVAPLYLSAPYVTGSLWGGVDVLVGGLRSFTIGRNFDTTAYATLSMKELVGTGDGSTKTFNKTLTYLPYVNMSVSKVILTTVLGVVTEIAVTCSNVATEVLTGSGLDTGSQLIRSSGALTLVFVSAPADDVTIQVVYQQVSTDVSHSIFAKSPCSTTWLAVKLLSKTAGAAGIYTIELYEKLVDNSYSLLQTISYSLVDGTLDSNGKPVYIGLVLDDHDYLDYKVNAAYTGLWTAITTSTSIFDIYGGLRNATITSSERILGWDYFQDKDNYPVDLFMETSGVAAVATSIYDLVLTYQKWSFGIITLPMGNVGAAAVIAAKPVAITDQIDFVCNWGRVYNKYTGSYVWSSLIGRDGNNMAVMAPVYDALSPAGIDENGYGGQLGSGIIELEQSFTDADLKLLDNACINPHVYSRKYGYYTGGDRTNLDSLTDTSYVGTRRLINLIIRTIANEIMPLQEFKNNDAYHRQLFEHKVNIIAKPILDGGYCRELVPVCDNTSVNSDAVMERREFAALVLFKATPNSQRLVLSFVRLSQGAVLADFIP